MKKIVIIGPESTGKSTLSQQLADHYKTLWCPEYAREYLLTHGTQYTYEDLLMIAKGQVALEDDYTKQTALQYEQQNNQTESLLFLDTDMYVMKVWCEYVFGKCHPFILEQVQERPYDLYLLCNVDLPWVKDELREYPDFRVRENLYEIYKGILSNQSTPWVSIYGPYEERLQLAINAVDELLT